MLNVKCYFLFARFHATYYDFVETRQCLRRYWGVARHWRPGFSV